MQKLRITDPLFPNFTGTFGCLEFVDGVSTREVTIVEAERIAGVILAELMDGSNPSVAQVIIDSQSTPMDEEMVRDRMDNGPAAIKPATRYSYDELAKLADEKGIGGLRVIGDHLGVKATSIPKLIELILSRAAKPEVE